jgi:hypothetical protein
MKLFLITILLTIVTVVATAQDSMFRRNSLGISVALPWANNYAYFNHSLKQSERKCGFGGLEASLFYKLQKTKVAVVAGATSDLPAPIGPIDFAKEGTRTSIAAVYVEAVYQRNLYRRLNLVAGANLVNYRFNFISYIDSVRGYHRNDKCIGITAGIKYYVLEFVELGIYYRPSLYSLSAKQYRHLISISAQLDIKLAANQQRR